MVAPRFRRSRHAPWTRFRFHDRHQHDPKAVPTVPVPPARVLAATARVAVQTDSGTESDTLSQSNIHRMERHSRPVRCNEFDGGALHSDPTAAEPRARMEH